MSRALLAAAFLAFGCAPSTLASGGDAPSGSNMDPTCRCGAGDVLTCASGTTTCALGCVNGVPSHCAGVMPSNGVDATLTSTVSNAVLVDAVTTFDTDSGAITGGITRAAGTGTAADIGYTQVGGLGVFTFANLTVKTTGTVHFTGSRPVVFLVGGSATIQGVIDGSGGCYGTTRGCAGPGGGTGGTFGKAATGCSPGGAGQTDLTTRGDSGGGGGGGGASGAVGGKTGASAAGTAGSSCIASALEPLAGGSGGGGGGPGASAQPVGGGGGGALQITALQRIDVTGTITMGGEGGAGGAGSTNAAAGSGGGAGGAILLEAISVNIDASGVLAANGGGGGGSGYTTLTGKDGEDGKPSVDAALGGATAGAPATSGGNGAAAMLPAQAAADAPSGNNGGGGGGGVGRIYIRTQGQPTLLGVISPAAGTGAIRSQ
jgi:hypothetical protein